MRKPAAVTLAIVAFLLPPLLQAQDNHQSKYAGQEKRAIKSLSDEDVAELGRGGGWGLAKAAELNGVPGPAHLLELTDVIPLSRDQVTAISAVHEDMRSKAIPLGERLIELEGELEEQFRTRTITESTLRSLLSKIADVRRELRYTHLLTHLKTPEILSEDQIKRYNSLRGYGQHPCANVPAGHDPAMWRKHNDCK